MNWCSRLLKTTNSLSTEQETVRTYVFNAVLPRAGKLGGAVLSATDMPKSGHPNQHAVWQND